MDVEKLRSLTATELQHQQQELNDQLFRLKFQLKMGQTESLNKIRGLRKDVARTHTVAREKQLGLVVESHHPAAAAAGDAATTAKPKKATGKGAKRKARPAVAAKSKTAKSKTAKPAKKKAATAKKRKK
jgi:large subunit ribosomal protein L29